MSERLEIEATGQNLLAVDNDNAVSTGGKMGYIQGKEIIPFMGAFVFLYQGFSTVVQDQDGKPPPTGREESQPVGVGYINVLADQYQIFISCLSLS